MPGHPNLQREYFQIIASLPSRFDHGKISYFGHGHVCLYNQNHKSVEPQIDDLMNLVERNRPNLVFRFFYLSINDKNHTHERQEFALKRSKYLSFHGHEQKATILMTPSMISGEDRQLERLYFSGYFNLESKDDCSKILLPAEISRWFTMDNLEKFDFSQVRKMKVGSVTHDRLTGFEYLTQLCALAPLLAELDFTNMSDYLIPKISEAIPDGKVLEKMSFQANFASTEKLLASNLTLRAREVRYRSLRGRLFENPDDAQGGGIKGLQTLNEHY